MEDFTNKYPYTDFHEMNLDWFLDHFDDVMKMIMQNNETVKGLIEYIHSLGLVVIDDNAPAPDKVYSSQKTQNLLNNKVDKITGYGLSQNDFTNTLKTKLEGIEAGANKTIVANTMSAYQTDPVEGGVIYQALNAKVDKVPGKQLSQENYTSTEKTKLADIADNATKTEIDDTFNSGLKIGTIFINDADTDLNVPVDDTLSDTSTNPLQNKAIYDLLQNILPEETAEGNPISITDASGLNAKSLSVTMNPIQDLHGQSAPYPAGGGKNKLDVGSPRTNVNGNVTYVVKDDGTVTVNGQASSSNPNTMGFSFTLPAGTYTLSGCPSGGSDSTYRMDITGLSITAPLEYGNGVTFTLTQTETGTARIRLNTNYNAQNLLFKPMIEVGSTKTDYAPYSNICPISGRTEASVTRTGKNQAKPYTYSASIVQYYGSGRIFVNGTASGTLYIPTTAQAVSNGFTFELKAGTYIPSFEQTPPSGIFINVSDENNNSLSQGEAFTLTKNTKVYVRAVVRPGTYEWNSGIQLEQGTTATEYEPYTAETNTATFPDTVYGGYYDFVSGNGTEEWVVVDMGDIDYTYSNNMFRFRPSNGIISGDIGANAGDFMCSIYQRQSDKVIGVRNLENMKCAKTSSATYCSYYFRDDNYTTVEDFKTAMSGQTFAYKLATPTEITLTPEDIELLKGQNVLWTDSNGNITLVYSADIKQWVLNQ